VISDEQEFETNLFKGLIKMAKLFLNVVDEGKDLGDVIISEIKNDREFFILAIGIYWGLVADLNFAHGFLHNLSIVMKKLREGVSEEEIIKEYEREWKFARMDDFMVYGG